MADVQDAESGAEPSMEEILASIRRIIADEKDPNAVEPPAAPAEEDALELTQMVQDDGSILDVTENEPLPEPEPSFEAQPAFEPEPVPRPQPAPDLDGDDLISDGAASAAASSLAALAHRVQDEKNASSPMGYTPLGQGSRTLESMVLELMKPMLKEWLDQNLPSIVDRLVQKEVERIARKAID